MIKNWRTLSLTVLLISGLTACSSSQQKSEQRAAAEMPQPQKIQLQPPNGERLPSGRPKIITKDLFNISVSPKQIRVNGTPIANLQALEQLLAAYPKPMLTLAAHRCLSTAASAEIMTLAQRHTDTAIAFGSYGSEEDEECQPVNKKKK